MNLRSIREARGLNQRQLAELVGVDQSTIQRAETMHSTARLATYVACAEALGVTLADLFADDRAALEVALVNAFRRVPVEKRAGVFGLIQLVQAENPAAASAGPAPDDRSDGAPPLQTRPRSFPSPRKAKQT